MVTPAPQNDGEATCAPPLKKEDGRLDWSMSAAELWRRVRAFDPWPGTYATIRGETVKVTRTEPETKPAKAAAGAVVSCGKEGIRVATGEGTLLLTELQPPGKRRMRACDYLMGHCLEPGDKL